MTRARSAYSDSVPSRLSKERPMAGNPDFDLFKLGEEHDELRSAIRALSEKEIAPYAKEVDEDSRFPEEARVALVNSGFNAIHVPEKYDGHGSEELKQQVLPQLASGEAMASYALSEREAGSDAAGMRTRAKADGDDWILNGTKCWITNGGKSTWYTVMAVTDPDKGANGISAFVVHRDDEGFTVGSKERKLGIKGSPTTELYFENCRIPGDRIIGEPGSGFKTALASLDHTRPTIGAQAVGIAQGALDAAIAYTKERRQFRRPVSDFQGVQFMLADMAMKVEAARLMVYSAAARAERLEPNLGFISSAAKCFASDVAMEVTTNAVQLFGGYGYTTDFPVERFMRDAKITQIYEGTNQIQRVVMSRALLK